LLSSAINPVDGSGTGAHSSLHTAWPVGDRILVSGYHTGASGNPIPTSNVPSWGSEAPVSGQDTAVLALLSTNEPVAVSYNTWIANFTEIPLEQRDPLDNPSGDGMANLLKYALGLDPSTVVSPATWHHWYQHNQSENQQLRFALSPQTADVTVIPEFSTTLAVDSWLPVPPQAIQQSGTDLLGRTIYEIQTDPENAPRFYRLRVEQNP
jgi:hypothetical protein